MLTQPRANEEVAKARVHDEVAELDVGGRDPGEFVH